MKLEKKMMVGSTFEREEVVLKCSPKTKIEPRSAKSRNPVTASPMASKNVRPQAVRRMMTAKMQLEAGAENHHPPVDATAIGRQRPRDEEDDDHAEGADESLHTRPSHRPVTPIRRGDPILRAMAVRFDDHARLFAAPLGRRSARSARSAAARLRAARRFRAHVPGPAIHSSTPEPRARATDGTYRREVWLDLPLVVSGWRSTWWAASTACAARTAYW
jgi:hypothetical protein